MSASQRQISLLLCLSLVAATAFAYRGLVNHEFISVDDETYLTNNPPVRAGLTWPGVRWAFTTFHASNWHPLTWLTLMASCDLFGVWPPGHHFVNEFLHTANVALLFSLLLRLTKRLGSSAFVAGVFALHPVHVESVAWLAERKDVLSGFFFFLTLHAYVSYARKPNWKRMAVVVAMCLLGLLSKPMLVTVPFVLLLLDYWPLRRTRICPIARDVLSKLPLPTGERAGERGERRSEHEQGTSRDQARLPSNLLARIPFLIHRV
ncbi:MAG TPA: hypothetical protein VL282_05715, partial [Tepidisphaeraceae bacterium]|nr:hypothetical protein [Tepidisphaeraceae bacterium]